MNADTTNSELQSLIKRCSHLKDFAYSEIAQGNKIIDIDTQSSAVDGVYVFENPLSKHENNCSSIMLWENRDTHYPLQSGYVCHECKIVIAGPIK